MFDGLLENAGQYIQTNPWLGIVAVFVGGALTASNPCVLAMIPLTMSFVAGQKEQQAGPLRAFLFSLVFVLGLAVTFTALARISHQHLLLRAIAAHLHGLLPALSSTHRKCACGELRSEVREAAGSHPPRDGVGEKCALGMIAALAGSMYGDVSGVWTWVVAAVCLVMGLHLLGVLDFTIPMPFSIQPKTRGVLGAFIMGLLFGAVSAPCAAPILVVLLTYLAGSDASVAYGAFLLLVYALGHSALILVAGTSMGLARKIIESRGITRATDIMRRGAGVVIIGVGVFFIYNGIK